MLGRRFAWSEWLLEPVALGIRDGLRGVLQLIAWHVGVLRGNEGRNANGEANKHRHNNPVDRCEAAARFR